MPHGASLRRSLRLTSIALLSDPVQAIHRTIGTFSADSSNQKIINECAASTNSSNPLGAGRCPLMISCVLDNLPGDVTAGMQSGANIGSLVPTILALLGSPPLELIQLSFLSPIRAVATCMFGLGLPSGLFRQLQLHLPSLRDQRVSTPRTREWVILVPKARSETIQLAKTVVTDLVTLLLMGLMLWRNLLVGYQTMVTWRCEYSFLLLCWPLACVAWLIIALVILQALSQTIEIVYSEDRPDTFRSRMDVIMMRYRKPRSIKRNASRKEQPHSTDRSQERTALHVTAANFSPMREPPFAASARSLDPHFVVRITMRHEHGWSWFESIIEALAVGIFLYATFVLTSSVFLSGEQAIIYAVVMILSLSAIRVMEAL